MKKIIIELPSCGPDVEIMYQHKSMFLISLPQDEEAPEIYLHFHGKRITAVITSEDKKIIDLDLLEVL